MRGRVRNPDTYPTVEKEGEQKEKDGETTKNSFLAHSYINRATDSPFFYTSTLINNIHLIKLHL
ncbi:cleft lip and palate associated transmembrane protein-related [Schistosoma mansoni]|uniref:cleft lip and palate associated transmembrane protein-related n=1 Tax=Schistosoma mansoni TaxID=6183 RepID=UPI00022DC5AF|nr:cleft lip and palate associated transmembrane protein-related [Schistosoma mansoni]|eukprot:XP_018653436.1 cleft lip and palate associated transmembrane protein-related [Schistosoma mansoni]